MPYKLINIGDGQNIEKEKVSNLTMRRILEMQEKLRMDRCPFCGGHAKVHCHRQGALVDTPGIIRPVTSIADRWVTNLECRSKCKVRVQLPFGPNTKPVTGTDLEEANRL